MLTAINNGDKAVIWPDYIAVETQPTAAGSKNVHVFGTATVSCPAKEDAETLSKEEEAAIYKRFYSANIA